MLYRTLGRTGTQVSALALGTVELGMDYGIRVAGDYGQPAITDAVRLVHQALDRGLNFIDTARAYGESEAVLGQALRGKRADVVLASKVALHLPDGALPTGQALKGRMLTSLSESLDALQTDHLDLWQIHNVDQAVLDNLEAIAEIFREVQAQGRVRWVGGSFYGDQLPRQALADDLFDVMQVTYSILDQRLADQVLPLAAERQIGVMARSVLLQGALTERADHLPDHLADLKARSRQFRQLVAEAQIKLTPAQVAIAFGLANRQISSVLIGVRTVAELNENLQAMAIQLPNDLLEALYALRLDDADLLNPGTWQL